VSKEKKRLPIGLENFEQIIKENYYYVDKTGLISELLRNGGMVNLFTRPRRFGKTLNMSMMEHFFSTEGDKNIFDGLEISKEKTLCEDYMGKYPVISVSLKSINAATYVGFTSTGSVWGSIIATFAVVLPSFILMLTISKFFLKYQKHPIVESIFNGLRPAVVGLLASAALVLMNAENFGSPTEDTYSFVISIIIFLIAFIGTRKYKANPILMIIACGIAGLLLY